MGSPLPLTATNSLSSFAPPSISLIRSSSSSPKHSEGGGGGGGRSLLKRSSNNNGGRCLSALSHLSPFKTILGLRSIPHRGGKTVKASTSEFTSPNDGDEVVDKMLEGSEVETNSSETSFLARLAIALGGFTFGCSWLLDVDYLLVKKH